MKRFLLWWFWLGNPLGRLEHEANAARLVQMEFWRAECRRLRVAFNKEPSLLLLHQHSLASRRFEQESNR